MSIVAAAVELPALKCPLAYGSSTDGLHSHPRSQRDEIVEILGPLGDQLGGEQEWVVGVGDAQPRFGRRVERALGVVGASTCVHEGSTGSPTDVLGRHGPCFVDNDLVAGVGVDVLGQSSVANTGLLRSRRRRGFSNVGMGGSLSI
jgi:hypothetical protein